MTIPSTSRKAGPLLGTGAQTAWPFTFKVFAESDIAVAIATSLGVETTLVLNTDYSVTLNANQETSPGGTVTYPISGTPLPVGSKLSIIGNLAYDQPLDLPSGGNFSPLALENELDRLTMQIQQVKETAGRALLVPVTSTASSALPAPEANKLIAWNETASALQNLSVSEIASVVAYGTAASDIFTGTGAQTAFVLSNNPGALNNLDVAIGGVTQLPGVDYTWSSGTTVTFTTAPPFGAKVLIRYMQALALGTADAGSVQYTPAGTGAVPTTVQAKMRESVSVLDFGAKGDGVTDDTAAILAALNAAKISGTQVVVPPGIYVVNELVLPENSYLCGTGLQNSNSTTLPSSVFKCTTGVFCISTASVPNTIAGYRIENLTVVGWSGASYGIKAIGTSGYLHNITVTGVTNGVGIRYSLAWRGGFDSVYIDNCSLGLLLGFANEAVNGTTFTNVTIELCTVGVYSYDIALPQIGNVFNSLIVEGCGATYHTGTWPAFLTLSAGFQSDTGMTSATVQGGIILEKNFYSQFNGLYLEINSGVYFWQGATGHTTIVSGIIEMLEPVNTYTGTPLWFCRSPADVCNVRLSWNDAIASALMRVSSNQLTSTSGLIFNTAGTARPLYYDFYLGTATIRPGAYNLQLRTQAKLSSPIQNLTGTIFTMTLAANMRIPCQSGTTFLINGLNQSIGLDADFAVDGQRITLIVKQDAVGGRTIAFAGSTFKVTWSETGNVANAVSSISFVYSATLGLLVQEGAQRVYA